MEKKERIIIVWIMAWAGLLVAVLYSPVGSPDLYSSHQYFDSNQGVAFENTSIANAPRGGVSSDNGAESMATMSFDNESKISGSYTSSGSSSSGPVGGGGSVSYNAASKQPKTNSGMGGGSFGGAGGTSSGSKGGGSAGGAGVVSTTSDLTNLGGASTNNKQSVDYLPGLGATDPGDEPTGPPIPVGDGWMLLLMFASAYIVWKKFRI